MITVSWTASLQQIWAEAVSCSSGVLPQSSDSVAHESSESWVISNAFTAAHSSWESKWVCNGLLTHLATKCNLGRDIELVAMDF
eukprot:2291240-Amphidinium_carterae.1